MKRPTYKEGDLLWVKSLARAGTVIREVDDGLYLVSIMAPEDHLIPESDLSKEPGKESRR